MKSPDRESAVRLSTPPRSIILSHHNFPSASDEPEPSSPTDTLNAEDFDDDPDQLVGVAQAVAMVHQKDNETRSRNHFRTIDRFHR